MGIPGFWVNLATYMAECLRSLRGKEAVKIPSAEDDSTHDDPASRGGRIPSPAFASEPEQQCDVLHVDMNGLMHPCTHDCGARGEPDSENEMFERVEQALRNIVKLVAPRKELHLAIDGVAPRAKVNQQRARRFSSAHETEAMRRRFKDAKARLSKTHFVDVEKLEPEPRWDHNAISPGTPFMQRLCARVHLIVQKMQTTKDVDGVLWRKLKVVVSDASIPGEGEHKITARIRAAHTSPVDTPMTHWIMGQDADLIVLGLALHLPRISILRHQLDYANGFRPFDDKFCIVLIDELRKMLLDEAGISRELSPVARVQVIDDFVLLCNFVGNDFLPRVPDVDVRFRGLSVLWKQYGLWRSRDDGGGRLWTEGRIAVDALVRYANFVTLNAPSLVLDSAKMLMQRTNSAAKRHRRQLREAQVAIIKQLEASDGRDVTSAVNGVLSLLRLRDAFVGTDHRFATATRTETHMVHTLKHIADTDEERASVAKEEKDDKDLRICNDLFRRRVIAYVKGLTWVQLYYLEGCRDWQWEYRDHYAPPLVAIATFASDYQHTDFSDVGPMTVEEQMLTILPRQSADLLAKPLRQLLRDLPRVSLAEDKSQAIWNYQSTVILPFVDRDALQKALAGTDVRQAVKEPTVYRVGKAATSEAHRIRRRVWYPLEQGGVHDRAMHEVELDRGVVQFLVKDSSPSFVWDTSAVLQAPFGLLHPVLLANRLQITHTVSRELFGLQRSSQVLPDRMEVVTHLVETALPRPRGGGAIKLETSDERIVAEAVDHESRILTGDQMMRLVAQAHRVHAYTFADIVLQKVAHNNHAAHSTTHHGDDFMYAPAREAMQVAASDGANNDPPPGNSDHNRREKTHARCDEVAKLRTQRQNQRVGRLRTTEAAIPLCRWTAAAPAFDQPCTGLTSAEWQRVWSQLETAEPSLSDVVRLHAFLQHVYTGATVDVIRQRLRNFPVDSPLTTEDLVACPKNISDAMRSLLQRAHAAECERPAYRKEAVSVLLVGTTMCPQLIPADDIHGHDAEVGVAVTDLRGIPLAVLSSTADTVAECWKKAGLVGEGHFLIVCCDKCSEALKAVPLGSSQVAVLTTHREFDPDSGNHEPRGPESAEGVARLRWPLSAQLRQMRSAIRAWASGAHSAPLGHPALYALCSLKALANATGAAAMCKRRQRSLAFQAMVPMQLNSVTAGEGVGGNAAKRLLVSITGKGVVDQGAFRKEEDLFGNTCAIVSVELTLPSFHADPHFGLNVNLGLLPCTAGRNRLVRTLYQLRIAGNHQNAGAVAQAVKREIQEGDETAVAQPAKRDEIQEGNETDHDGDDVRDAHPPQPTVAPTQARQPHATHPPTKEKRRRGPAKEVVDGLVGALVHNRSHHSDRSRRGDNKMGYVEHCLLDHMESLEGDATPDRKKFLLWPVTVQAEYIDELYYTAAMFHLGAAFAPLLRHIISDEDAYLFFEESTRVRVARLTAKVYVTVPKYLAIEEHRGDGLTVRSGSHPPQGLHPVRFLHDVLAHPAMKRDPNVNPPRFVSFIIRAELLPLATWRMAEAKDFCPMLRALLTSPEAVKELLDVKRYKHARQQPELQKAEAERNKCKVFVGYDAVRALDAAIKGGQGEISRVATQIRDLLLSFVDSIYFCHPTDNPDHWFPRTSFEARNSWGSVLATPTDVGPMSTWELLRNKAGLTFIRTPLPANRVLLDGVAVSATTHLPMDSSPRQRLHDVITGTHTPPVSSRPTRAPQRPPTKKFYLNQSPDAATAMNRLVDSLCSRKLRHGRVLFYGADLEAEYNLTPDERRQWGVGEEAHKKPSPLQPVEIPAKEPEETPTKEPALWTGLWTTEAVPTIAAELVGETSDDEEEHETEFPDQCDDLSGPQRSRDADADDNTARPRKVHRTEGDRK
jgi:hypothetical protein